MAEPTHTFTPFWLMSLDDKDKVEVQEWLKKAGVNIDLCPGFDYDGNLITTRYYQVNENGQALMNEDGPVYEEGMKFFNTPPTTAPSAVTERMWMARNA